MHSAQIAYQTLIENALKIFAESQTLTPTPWYHDMGDCFLTKDERPFFRSIQISIEEESGGMFIVLIPDLYRDDEENHLRYVCDKIPLSLIRRARLPDLPMTKDDTKTFTANFLREISMTLGNTYYITPDMLTTEIKLSSHGKLR